MTLGPPKWGVPEAQWTENDHLAFRVYVALEHLRGRMPIVELHRNHDVPLSRVRRWISTYQQGGVEAVASRLRGERRPLKSYR